MKRRCGGKAIIALCAILMGGSIAFGYTSWYDEVERSEPPYTWMQELGSVKLTWGIPFSEYAKPQPLSRLQFVRDIMSAVDALRLVLERVKEKKPSLTNPSLEEICEAVSLPAMTVGDVERIAALLRALINYFANDINTLSLEEDAKHLLHIVDLFESTMKAFPSKPRLGTQQPSIAESTSMPLKKSQHSNATLSSARQDTAKAGFAPSTLDRLEDAFESAHDVVIAYWLGESKVLLNDTTTTIVLPSMSLRISNWRLQSTPPYTADRVFSAQVAIPFGEQWRLLGGYTQRLPAWSKSMRISDLLRYSSVEVGGQYKGDRLSAFALYTRFGEGGAFSDLESMWRTGDALHGVAFGFAWHPSERLLARYRLQLLSSVGEDGRAYRVHMGQVDYLWGKRWTLTFGLRRAIAPFNADAISTGAVLGVSYMISPQAELRLLYQITDYESKQRDSQEETARLQVQLRF